MTRTEIIADARKLIYETDSGNTHFSDAELVEWYEQWHTDIAMWSKWPRAEAIVSGGSVAEQTNYPIDASKVLEILGVYYKGKLLVTKTVEGLDDLNIDWRNDLPDTPVYSYMADSDVIGLYPKPKVAADEIRIRYVKIPNVSTSGNDVPDVSAAYHLTASYFIVSKAHRSIGNNGEANNFEQLYMAKKREVKGSVKVMQKQFGWDWSGAGSDL